MCKCLTSHSCSPCSFLCFSHLIIILHLYPYVYLCFCIPASHYWLYLLHSHSQNLGGESHDWLHPLMLSHSSLPSGVVCSTRWKKRCHNRGWSNRNAIKITEIIFSVWLSLIWNFFLAMQVNEIEIQHLSLIRWIKW